MKPLYVVILVACSPCLAALALVIVRIIGSLLAGVSWV